MGIADGVDDFPDLVDHQRLDGDFLGILAGQRPDREWRACGVP